MRIQDMWFDVTPSTWNDRCEDEHNRTLHFAPRRRFSVLNVIMISPLDYLRYGDKDRKEYAIQVATNDESFWFGFWEEKDKRDAEYERICKIYNDFWGEL